MFDFHKEIRPVRNTKLLSKWIAEGEHVHQDFKYTVNDPRKIARSISAFANNSGGRLLIGVNDNGIVKGVNSEEDIFVVDSAATIYCEPPCHIEYTSFRERGGFTVVCAEIIGNNSKPYYVIEEHNKLKAYYRVADENIIAHPLHLKALHYKFSDDKKGPVSMSSEHSYVIEMIGKQLTFDELAFKVRVSRRRLEQIVIELFDIGLIDFAYIKRSLYICSKIETNSI